jgi:GTPase
MLIKPIQAKRIMKKNNMDNHKEQLPLVVIFGRTNVGKSTLFNTLTEKKKALTSEMEGTTRDSNIADLTWNGESITLVDTGGIIDHDLLKSPGIKKDIDTKVQEQARGYLSRADLILFVVDTRSGILPQDKKLAIQLKKIVDPDKIILVANKADSPRLRKEVAEFHKLGWGEPVPVSAANGSGTGDLLDLVVKTKRKGKIKKPATRTFEKTIRTALLGKPNVGKSSLLNSILGEDKVIVSPVPHTTREPQDTEIIHGNNLIQLIDTAGISKKGQKSVKKKGQKNSFERLSIAKSLSVIKKADLVLFVIDVKEGLTVQDAKIVEAIIEKGASLVIVANKWDLVEEKDVKEYTQAIYSTLPFITWVPIQFVSALTGSKINKLLDLVEEVYDARQTEIGDSTLNKFLQKIIKKHRPAKAKGTKHPYIYELKQVKTNPPKFMIRIGAKDTIHFSYLRFIENRLREQYGFLGTPVRIGVEKGRLVHGKAEEYIVNRSKNKK